MQRGISLLVGLAAVAFGLIVVYQIEFVATKSYDSDKVTTPAVLLATFAVGFANLWVAAQPNRAAARIIRLAITTAILLAAATGIAYARGFAVDGIALALFVIGLAVAFGWQERGYLSRRA